MAVFLIDKQADENWVTSLDGSKIYVACNDGYLRTYDATDGSLIVETYIGGDLDGIAIHPIEGGNTLAITSGTLSDIQGSGESFTATARVILVDTGDYSLENFDIPVSGNGRSFADVAFSPVNYLMLSQNVSGGGLAPVTILNLSDGSTTESGSYYSGSNAPSLTPWEGQSIALIGELGRIGGRYDLVDGSGFDWDDSTSSAGAPNGALDQARGIEATSWDGFLTAIFANGQLHLFQIEFQYLGTLANFNGTSGDISALAFSADGSILYAVDNIAATITLYDTATLQAVQEIPIGQVEAALLPYGDELFITADQGRALMNTPYGILSIDLSSPSIDYPESSRHLVGSQGEDILEGLYDADILEGRAGDDTLLGADGDDALYGNAGNDSLLGEAGDDQLQGGNGGDIAHGGTGDDLLIGNYGNDELFGDEGNDRLFGGFDHDTIFGGDGIDTIRGGAGNDTIDGGLGYDSIFGGSGEDIIFGDGGSDFIYGGHDADQLFGQAGYDTIYGDAGDDIIDGGIADDHLYGGSENDTIHGGNGADVIRGGSGDDKLKGGAGADNIGGGSGSDVLTGGAGSDIFLFADASHLDASLALTDVITDFTQAESDIISVYGIDADTTTIGDQRFAFIGDDAFTGSAGQLRYFQLENRTIIEMDTDGDGNADLCLALDGLIDLTSADFAL